MPAIKSLLSCLVLILLLNVTGISEAISQQKARFHVLGVYTAKHDMAHISFVHEANKWFAAQATKYNFAYDSTNDWSRLNTGNLAQYQVVVFLDTRPDDSTQRVAFENYMK